MDNGDRVIERLSRLEGEFHTFADFTRQDLGQIKTTLGQVLGLLTRLDQKLEDVPTPAAFAELRGRVEEISRRLPTTIGYNPPAGKKHA